MSSLMLFAGATCTSGGCQIGKCAIYAVPSLAVALIVGYVIGYLVGRRSAAKNGAKKAPQPQQKKQAPVRRDPRPVSSHPPIPAGSVELYVGNLSYDMTEDQLREQFERLEMDKKDIMKYLAKLVINLRAEAKAHKEEE